MNPVRITAREVACFVATEHGLTYAALIGPCRRREFARPRQIAMYAIRALCRHMSYPSIGRVLGGRDHTTILHGVRKIKDLMVEVPEIADSVANVLRHFATEAESAPKHREPQPTASPVLMEQAMAWQALCNSYGRAMARAT